MAKGKVKEMHVKSMAGGHTLKIHREPDPDQGKGDMPMSTMMDNQPEESMHPDGTPGADHIAGLMAAHDSAMKSKGKGKKSAAMDDMMAQKAFGRNG